uniref:C-type lectin domain-containing protein n=1 Tax=Biomphalaria glabrata TaxID=6526 RepID=A0A2C9K560_BIOGL
MGAIVLLLLISFVHSPVTSQDINLCPDGPAKDRYLKVHGDFCYQFVVYRKYTHSEAQTDCELQGGSLVLVKTADIQNFVYQQLTTTYNDAYDRVWIGLNDLAQEDHYVWEDGTKLGFYSNWYQGEGPSSTTANHNFTHITRDCVVMDISPSVGGKWRESSCESSAVLLVLSAREAHSYVCQYSIISTTDYSTTSYYYSTTSTDFFTNTADFSTTTSDYSTTTSDYSTTTSDYSTADFSTTKKGYPSSTADFSTTTSDYSTTTSDYSTTTSKYSTSV